MQHIFLTEYCKDQYIVTQQSDKQYYYRHHHLECEEYIVCYLGYGKVNRCPPGWQLDVASNKCSLVCQASAKGGS